MKQKCVYYIFVNFKNIYFFNFPNTNCYCHCFSIELAKNEITQSSDKLREKNAVRDGKLNTS